MGRVELGHRELEFSELTRGIVRGLEHVYADGQAYAAVLLTGSGTAAVESMLATFAPRVNRTLVATNGVYGERIAEILQLQGKPHVTIEGDWLGPLDLDAIDNALRADSSITHVAAVHHETTTGRLNDIDALGRLCVRTGRRLLLDTVSSFGAEKVRFEDWSLLALAASANKCLHSVPGLAFVVASRAALNGKSEASTLYLDAQRYYRMQSVDGFSPFTQSVQVALALAEALAELSDEGGWLERRLRYERRAVRISDALASVGIEPVLPRSECSSVLRSYHLPHGVTYRELHAVFKANGFIIYDGQARLKERIFRIAHMGDLSANDVDRLCDVFAGFAPSGRAGPS